ncbi:hypothetical protein NMG60_11031798 [Bertholletia excelsa]
MKYSPSTARPCQALKSFSHRVGGILCCHKPPNKYKKLDSKLERKMSEIWRSSSGNTSFRSINSVILRFPEIKEGLKDIKSVFEQYDEDSNGTIDYEELKKCLEKLQVHLTEKEIDELFHSCDVDGYEEIQFKEFLVLLCLVYFLTDHATSPQTISKMGSPQLEATFNTIIEVFQFLDKNGDGKLNKTDMFKALNEDTPREKFPAHVSRTRFKEMDWDRKGKVSFREFLFSLIDWIGIDSDEETPVAS